jgi:hypothetical protein
MISTRNVVMIVLGVMFVLRCEPNGDGKHEDAGDGASSCTTQTFSGEPGDCGITLVTSTTTCNGSVCSWNLLVGCGAQPGTPGILEAGCAPVCAKNAPADASSTTCSITDPNVNDSGNSTLSCGACSSSSSDAGASDGSHHGKDDDDDDDDHEHEHEHRGE